MSEISPPEVTLQKKQKLTFKLKMAMLEVIERKKFEDRIDFKAVAVRHNCSAGTLRNLWMKYTRDQIDLGTPETAQEKQIDAKVQHEKQLQLLRRYRAMILRCFEGTLYKAEDMATTKKDPLAWAECGLPKFTKELKALNDLIGISEKGYLAILEEAAADNAAKERGLKGREVTEIETRVISANDEALALSILSNGA